MNEPTGVEAALEVLYGVPLEAFVDERKRLAQELRRGGEKSAATEIAKWRKPSAAAWALNRVAREAPDVAAEWLAAGAALRDASARPAEVGGEAVRAAIAAHRSATSRLLEVLRDRARPGGRPLSEDMLDRARSLLQAATTDDRVADLLRRGRIDEEALPAADAGVMTAPSEIRTDRVTPTIERDPDAEQRAAADAAIERQARERAERMAELERRIVEAQTVIEGLAKEREDRVVVADESSKRVEAARRALSRAETKAEAARAAVTEFDAPLREAQSGLDQLRARMDADDA